MNNVLIVDDDNVSNFIAEKVIKGHGGVRMVTAVTDGKQALDFLKYQCEGDDIYACPDLILLDLNMPYFDGYEFLQRYKKNEFFPGIPVVAVTATDPPEKEQAMLRDAGVPFLIKPLTGEKFNKIFSDLQSA